MEYKELFLKTMVAQVRALDLYGSWSKISDEELLTNKYVKTKEQLKEIPIVADINDLVKKDIRMIYEALALAFEKVTGEMASVIMEMSSEGFGRVVVLSGGIVLVDKLHRDAHRFGYRELDKFIEDGAKMLEKAVSIYQSYIELKGIKNG